MALAHTILTVLANQPSSGYDISKRFEESVSCFWKASQQQIYRELAKMERQGWVSYETIPQAGKPDKKIYSATEQGLAELLFWFKEPSEPTPIREDLLVKVLAGATVSRSLLRQEVLYRRNWHDRQLYHYREKEALYHNSSDLPLAEHFRYLTLRRGIRYEQEWIEWCDEVLEFLDRLGD
ncbi:MAG: PadR family transcriptional regulator [Prochlorothrix sp.]